MKANNFCYIKELVFLYYISPITVYSDLHFELMQVVYLIMYIIHIFGIIFFGPPCMCAGNILHCVSTA